LKRSARWRFEQRVTNGQILKTLGKHPVAKISPDSSHVIPFGRIVEVSVKKDHHLTTQKRIISVNAEISKTDEIA